VNRRYARPGPGAAWIAVLVLLGASGARAGTLEQVFVVEVPVSTPPDAAIWISGNLPALGSWNGAGARLERIGERRYATRIALEPGVSFEFKVTRGGWETVEKDARGGEMANRRATAGTTDTVRAVVAAWRDQKEGRTARRSTLTGRVDRHPQFPSCFVRPRDILVWLPPGYDADSTRSYPVLYFHDGNNVLDAATSFKGIEWGVDEAAERMIRSGGVRPFVVVAVYNTPDRVAEYTPVADAQQGGGRAHDYERFLLDELVPFVDRTYRTLPGPQNRGLAGSSLGAIVSLHVALRCPERFGLVGCVSPAAWWGSRDIVKRAATQGRGAPLRIWLDIGTEEGTESAGRKRWLEDARALRDALVSRGYREGGNLHYEEIEGAVHDEGAWAARVDRMLSFLLGPPER
jgi:predicted alpha/beta superfamily hydrolase